MQCAQGKKSVLFVTGLCPRRCSYCPISDEKKNTDITFINEWETAAIPDMLEEIRACRSKGVGITGGDPLASINRTCDCILAFKKTFGKKFHVHLYTSINLLTKDRLDALFTAGLDEIRVHPDVHKPHEWPRLAQLRNYPWKVTIEIPVVPDELAQVKDLLTASAKYIDYLNLNELEVADNSFSTTREQYATKDSLSYAVKGSERVGFAIMKFANELGIKNVHFCTARLKDAHQLTRRIKRRAKTVKKPFEKITDEGMFLRAAIYPKKMGKHKPIKADMKKLLAITKLLEELGIAQKNFFIDEDFGRVLTSQKLANKHSEELKKKYFVYLLEEYPTKDAFPIVVEEL